MRKRDIGAVMLAAAVMLAVNGCGGGGKTSSPAAESTTESGSAESSTAESSAASTEESTAEEDEDEDVVYDTVAEGEGLEKADSCDIELSHVSFGYDDRQILDGVSLSIPAGTYKTKSERDARIEEVMEEVGLNLEFKHNSASNTNTLALTARELVRVAVLELKVKANLLHYLFNASITL